MSLHRAGWRRCAFPHRASAGSASARLLLKVDVRERVAVVIPDDKADGVRFFDGPRRREATGGHSAGSQQLAGSFYLGIAPIPQFTVEPQADDPSCNVATLGHVPEEVV